MEVCSFEFSHVSICATISCSFCVFACMCVKSSIVRGVERGFSTCNLFLFVGVSTVYVFVYSYANIYIYRYIYICTLTSIASYILVS